MGRISEDVTRLQMEMEHLRGARHELLSQLGQGAKDLRETVLHLHAGFRKTRGPMAERMVQTAGKVRGDLNAFRSGLTRDVSALRRDVLAAHTRMAHEASRDRKRFVSDVQTSVRSLRRHAAEDLHGARRALGCATPSRRRTAQGAPGSAEVSAKAMAGNGGTQRMKQDAASPKGGGGAENANRTSPAERKRRGSR
jgi:hypothetical protein